MQRGRKKKVRYIGKLPKIAQFSPRGKPGRPDEIILKLDEFEALNLADFLGYSQVEAAEFMGISRASFGRIVRSARRTIANALVNGKTIKIGIGDVQVGVRQRNLPHKEMVKEKEDGAQIEKNLRNVIVNYVNRPKKK